MRILAPALSIVFGLLSVRGISVAAVAGSHPIAPRQMEARRRCQVDPSSALESRVGETAPSVLAFFKHMHAAPSPHSLSDEERRILSAAFAALPPLHRRVLGGHLRRISFLDGMPNTALTSTVGPDAPDRLFDITIRASILRQTTSEWLTEKERTCFSTGGSRLSLSIEAGKRQALEYVLLHEATHVVDLSLGITSHENSSEESADTAALKGFADGVWIDARTPAPQYRDPLRDRISFYTGGCPMPIEKAAAGYEYLRRTPFVSLYGAGNRGDDLAEYVAIYQWTQVLRQPYRAVIRDHGRVVFTFDPMKSPLVRGRFAEMKPLGSDRSSLPQTGRSEAFRSS